MCCFPHLDTALVCTHTSFPQPCTSSFPSTLHMLFESLRKWTREQQLHIIARTVFWNKGTQNEQWLYYSSLFEAIFVVYVLSCIQCVCRILVVCVLFVTYKYQVLGIPTI